MTAGQSGHRYREALVGLFQDNFVLHHWLSTINSIWSAKVLQFNVLFLSASGFCLPNWIGMRIRCRFEPSTQRQLLLRIKLHTFRTLNVQIAEERLVPAGEWKPGH